MRKKKGRIPAALRWEVWERDDFACRYCGSRRYLHVDHRVPESQGGPTTAENLVTLCGRCNRRKGAKTHEEYERIVCLKWAVDHVLKQAPIPRFGPIPGHVIERVSQFADVQEMVRAHPDLIVPIGDGWENFINLTSADPAHFAELIDDRHARGKHAEAEKFTAMAVAKYGPDFRSLAPATPPGFLSRRRAMRLSCPGRRGRLGS